MQHMKVEELTTKLGNNTLKVNGYLLHSKYDPKKEAVNFVKKNYKKNKVLILFGYGKGYILDEFLDVSDQEKIIVIDPYFSSSKVYSDRVTFISKLENNKGRKLNVNNK